MFGYGSHHTLQEPKQVLADFFMHPFSIDNNQLQTLLEGLRYLEIHHPTDKKEFRNLLDTIYQQYYQTLLFSPTAPKDTLVGGQKREYILKPDAI